MAFTERGVCSVCGRELKGRVFNCSDGVYCGDCRKKAFLVFPGETADLHTADEIREKLEKYSDAIANRDKVSKPEYCPVCGKKLLKLMNLRILDDYICMDCAEKAAAFIGVGYNSVSCMLLSEILPLFDRVEVRGGREDSDGVFVEADALRVAFPLIKTYGEDEFSGDLTWSTSKGVITMTVSLCGQSQTREYRYIISGRTLTVIDVDDPDDVTILKKK